MIDKIIELVDAYWKFDSNQQHMSSWHDKQDLLDAIRKLKGDNKQRSIAVISLDTQDFLNWKSENNLVGDGLEHPRRFKIGNTTYYCISKVINLCSLRVDGVIETKYAKENKEYEKIISTIKHNIIL